MGRAIYWGKINAAKLILSTGLDLGATAADVFNHREALFQAKSRSAEVVEFEWALEKCMADSSPERPFGGLNLESQSGRTLLQHCEDKTIATPCIRGMLQG